MNKPESTPSLDSVINQINKAYGPGSLVWLGSSEINREVETIPTGSFGLDLALGVGGYPKGRVVEIYGPEMSGKTTLALAAVANTQRAGSIAAFVDAEQSFNAAYAKVLGVDIDRLLISQPSTGEEALEIVDQLVSSGDVGIIIVDSVAALVPKAELDGEMGDSHIGLQARLMSQAMRKLTAKMAHGKTTVIFINQLREKVGVMFGSPEVTSGGKALKFYASVRLDVRRVDSIKVGTEVVGNKVKVKVVKNKVAAPFKETIFPLVYAVGIDRDGELLEVGERKGLITKAGGGWYYVGQFRLGRGEGAKTFLRENPNVADQIRDAIRNNATSLEIQSEEPAATITDAA